MLSKLEWNIVKDRLKTDPEQFPKTFSFEEIVDLVKVEAAQNDDFDIYMECLSLESSM